jgi:hypothetical protein
MKHRITTTYTDAGTPHVDLRVYVNGALAGALVFRRDEKDAAHAIAQAVGEIGACTDCRGCALDAEAVGPCLGCGGTGREP